MKRSRWDSLFLLFLGIITVMFCMLAVNVNAGEWFDVDGATVSSDGVYESDEYETHNLVDITIELEDSTRFMGVAVYQIGRYEDGKFYYELPYRDLVNYDYEMNLTESTIENHVKIFTDYIEDNNQIPDAIIEVSEGTGKTEGLQPGLYLLIQDEDMSHNSQLKKTILIEGPTFDKETGELLFDIRSYPLWERTVWFKFRPEVVEPMTFCILLLACFMFCFLGGRAIKAIIFMIPFALTGIAGMKVAMQMELDYIWLMVIYVFLGFIGAGLTYLIWNLISSLCKRIAFFRFIVEKMFWITAVIGAFGGAYLIYKYITQEVFYFVLIPCCIMVLGIIWQIIQKKRRPEFHTYDDLLALSVHSSSSN